MSVRAVSFSDINYWIGEGNVEAMLVIAWNDGKTPETLAWGYKGEEETTIVEMLNDVVKTDPRLFSLMRRQGGYTVDGLGFLRYTLPLMCPFTLLIEERGTLLRNIFFSLRAFLRFVFWARSFM